MDGVFLALLLMIHTPHTESHKQLQRRLMRLQIPGFCVLWKHHTNISFMHRRQKIRCLSFLLTFQAMCQLPQQPHITAHVPFSPTHSALITSYSQHRQATHHIREQKLQFFATFPSVKRKRCVFSPLFSLDTNVSIRGLPCSFKGEFNS